MSTVQDEADNGHAELSEDEKNEQDGNNVIGEDNDEIASFGELQEPGKREVEEESVIRNGAAIEDRSGRTAETPEEGSEHSEPPSHRALDRPSSADGSLSIPDDTPSIQVHTRQGTFSCYGTHSTHIGFFSIFSS